MKKKFKICEIYYVEIDAEDILMHKPHYPDEVEVWEMTDADEWVIVSEIMEENKGEE